MTMGLATDTQRHNFQTLRKNLRGVARGERLRTYAAIRAGGPLSPLGLPILLGIDWAASAEAWPPNRLRGTFINADGDAV